MTWGSEGLPRDLGVSSILDWLECADFFLVVSRSTSAWVTEKLVGCVEISYANGFALPLLPTAASRRSCKILKNLSLQLLTFKIFYYLCANIHNHVCRIRIADGQRRDGIAQVSQEVIPFTGERS
jgi:hypothetical protein